MGSFNKLRIGGIHAELQTCFINLCYTCAEPHTQKHRQSTIAGRVKVRTWSCKGSGLDPYFDHTIQDSLFSFIRLFSYYTVSGSCLCAHKRYSVLFNSQQTLNPNMHKTHLSFTHSKLTQPSFIHTQLHIILRWMHANHKQSFHH